ncbi:hypothetical protein MESS2_850017 [Mesorhizobium metallidurans STM 2683]|uniref:Uncharacterized protein n=1 Tax=Mesorhizobium metallidurans STM 2683 TaxID=1297569 RepID=M5EYJ8_9HYPH|nr:hypothetical protein MESS2_850017 [Mesorhizobium metallidurans STM 2683]
MHRRSNDPCGCAGRAPLSPRPRTAGPQGGGVDSPRSRPFLEREDAILQRHVGVGAPSGLAQLGTHRRLGRAARHDPEPAFSLAACGLGGVDRVIGDGAHGLDRPEDRGFVDMRAPLLPQALQCQAMLPQADRRPPQVAIGKVVIGAIGPKQIDAAEIARVVADDHPLGMADPGAEHVSPVGDRVQRHAITPDPATLDRQEVDQEAARVGHGDRRATAERGAVAGDAPLPGRQGRHADAPMQIAVIDAGDRMAEPALDLVDRHGGALLGIQVALLLDAGERRAGQQVDLAHHGADQPLDMAAIVRRAHRPMVDRDPILLAPALQRLGPELLGVVEVQAFRDAANRPLCVDGALGEPALLGECCVGQAERDGRRRGRLQRQVEAGDAARADVDRQGQPGALDRCARLAVDHDHVDQRVVDLDQRQRPVSLQRTDDRSVTVARRLGALALGDHLPTRAGAKPGCDGSPARRSEAARRALAQHLLDQVHDLGLLAREIDAVDRLLDQHVHLVLEPGEAGARPSLARQQARQSWISDVAADQGIDVGRPTAQFRRASFHVRSGSGRIVRQAPDDRQEAAGFIPSGRAHGRDVGHAHAAPTRVLGTIGADRSTTRAPRAIRRQTTASPASRVVGKASTSPMKSMASARARTTANSASAVSIGTFLSGSNLFAASRRGPRMPRSVAILKRAPCSPAQARAAANAGLSRCQSDLRSARYLISTISEPPALQSTRKSGVYRRDRCPCRNRIVTGCSVTTAPASVQLTSVTKSRSRALSCSATPVARAWNPVTCDRRLRGMRRRIGLHLQTTQYANIAHFGVSSQTWDNIYVAKPLRGLSFRSAPIHETRRTDRLIRRTSDGLSIDTDTTSNAPSVSDGSSTATSISEPLNPPLDPRSGAIR